MPNQYVVVQQVADRLGLAFEDLSTVNENLLQAACEWATAFIEAYCDRVFIDAADTRFYRRDAVDPFDSHLLYLGADFTQISVVVNGDGTTIASDQFFGEPRNAISENRPYYALRLLSTSSFVWPTDGWVRVSGGLGYSSEPDPLIVGVCLRLAEYHYRSKTPLSTTTTLFDGSTNNKDTLPIGFPTGILTELDLRKRLAP